MILKQPGMLYIIVVSHNMLVNVIGLQSLLLFWSLSWYPFKRNMHTVNIIDALSTDKEQNNCDV